VPWGFDEQELSAGIQASGQRCHGCRWRNGLVNHVQRKSQVAPLVVEAEILVRALAKLDTVEQTPLVEAFLEAGEHAFLYLHAHDLSGRPYCLRDGYGEEAQRGA
jgi:hypothetical protein